MESRLEATTKKFEKCDKERRFYKGTVDLVNKPTKNFSAKKPSKHDIGVKQPLLDDPPLKVCSEALPRSQQVKNNNHFHQNLEPN